jgi:HTH-type transcriptional regulator, competence development regulator
MLQMILYEVSQIYMLESYPLRIKIRQFFKCVIYRTLFFTTFTDIVYVNKEEKIYNEELKKFGVRLRKIRKRNNLTQLDLDIRTGIQRSEISRIENGLRNIEFYTIVKLSLALDIPISDFFADNQI